jgi:hypothetical protein
MSQYARDVRFRSKADIQQYNRYVRFTRRQISGDLIWGKA